MHIKVFTSLKIRKHEGKALGDGLKCRSPMMGLKVSSKY